MSAEPEEPRRPEHLPVAPAHICEVAVDELANLADLVHRLSVSDWSRRSAIEAWSLGDVVVHLNLATGLYSRLLDSVLAGGGSGAFWQKLGDVGKRVAPAASPAFNAINSLVPRLVDRALAPEVLKGQFAANARKLGERLNRVGPEDYGRAVSYLGGPLPLSFFLTGMINELALHRWDIESRIDPTAHLSEGARSVLPWFYWGATSWMLRLPGQTTGRVTVSLVDPMAEMWWDITSTGTSPQMGRPNSPDVTIAGESSTWVLAISGRIPPADALRSTSLRTEGRDDLGVTFLQSWKIV